MEGLKNKPELADVLRQFGEKFIAKEKLSPQQFKALLNIAQCRTATLGGHEEVCDNCGKTRYSYNSCGDRHCPKCQAMKQAKWVEDLIELTLPVKHHHIIFTLPHCLNQVCLWDSKMYYNLFFNAVWQTLHSFGYTHYSVATGAVAVLHSWGSNLSLHPHIHCIVPAVGYTLDGRWKHIDKYEKFLYPVWQLSGAFKGKFLDSLKRKLRKKDMLKAFDQNIEDAYNTKWVVNSEPSLAKAEHVIRYLGQYTHRVAISNKRILNISSTHVTFIAKDYRDKAQKKPVTMEGTEFLRRFCMHVFPKRFVRIRRFGIYNHTTIRNLDLQFVPVQKPTIQQLENPAGEETTAQQIKRLTGFDVGLCPACKKGRMHIVREIPRSRSPPKSISKLLSLVLL
jgi:hypothetical protein